MLTRTQLSKELNISSRTIDRYREKGMPHIKIDKIVRFDLYKVKEWLEKQSKGV